MSEGDNRGCCRWLLVGCSLAIHCLAAVADALIQLKIKKNPRIFRLMTCVGGFCLQSRSLFPYVIRSGGGYFLYKEPRAKLRIF